MARINKQSLNNPSLRLTPRHEPGDVIPSPQETSILDWLEASGRMMPREDREEEPRETDEDLDGLMGESVDNNEDYDDNEGDEG